jgi:hypothetical protein
MSDTPAHAIATRRNLIALAAIELALFVIANLTAKSSSHPGTVSNVAWVAFLLGAVLLVVLAVATVVRSRRPAR